MAPRIPLPGICLRERLRTGEKFFAPAWAGTGACPCQTRLVRIRAHAQERFTKRPYAAKRWGLKPSNLEPLNLEPLKLEPLNLEPLNPAPKTQPALIFQQPVVPPIASSLPF